MNSIELIQLISKVEWLESFFESVHIKLPLTYKEIMNEVWRNI